jgi:hypothetical protein
LKLPPRLQRSPNNQDSRKGKDFARELLEFYDQFSELNACCAFVLQAAVRIVDDGEITDRRSATGAIYCAQWLEDRMAELEQNLRRIERKAFAASKKE